MSQKEDNQQNALADVNTAARLLHQLRGLASEVEGLLASAMSTADSLGLTKSIVAEAAGVSRGRVSQIVAATPDPAPSRRLYTISEWPGDALRGHLDGFLGHMTYPPYSRRRPSATAVQE